MQVLCDVSVSIVLNSSANGAASEYWPLVLERNPSENLTSGRVVRLFAETIGGGFLFRGRDFMHWRGPLAVGEYSSVALLHYVFADSEIPIVDCVIDVNTGTQSTTQQLPTFQNVRADVAFNQVCTVQNQSQDDRQVPRFFLYSPCVELPTVNASSPTCIQQFGNQVFSFYHALLSARATGRVLVLPPFVHNHDGRDDNANPRQTWQSFEEYFNISQLARYGFEVIRFEEFINETGKAFSLQQLFH